ncbi:MAG: PilZ domain-containing protein [Methylovirgula sp.]
MGAHVQNGGAAKSESHLRTSVMEDRRKFTRRRVLKRAKIVFDNRSAVIDYTIRILSDEGANLLLPSTVGVPEMFELLIRSDGVRVVWRVAGKLGVFFPEKPKP